MICKVKNELDSTSVESNIGGFEKVGDCKTYEARVEKHYQNANQSEIRSFWRIVFCVGMQLRC